MVGKRASRARFEARERRRRSLEDVVELPGRHLLELKRPLARELPPKRLPEEPGLKSGGEAFLFLLQGDERLVWMTKKIHVRPALLPDESGELGRGREVVGARERLIEDRPAALALAPVIERQTEFAGEDGEKREVEFLVRELNGAYLVLGHPVRAAGEDPSNESGRFASRRRRDHEELPDFGLGKKQLRAAGETFRDVVHLKAEAAFGRAVGGGGLRGAAPEGAAFLPATLLRIVLDPDVVRVGGAFGLGVVSQSPAESAAEEVGDVVRMGVSGVGRAHDPDRGGREDVGQSFVHVRFPEVWLMGRREAAHAGWSLGRSNGFYDEIALLTRGRLSWGRPGDGGSGVILLHQRMLWMVGRHE